MRINHTIAMIFSLGIALTAAAGEGNSKRDYLGVNPESYLQKKKSAVKFLERKTPRSALKINLSQLIIKNISLQYEFSFERHVSICIGVSQLLSRPLPGLFVDDDPTGNGLRNTNYKGFSVTPEIRFYPGVKLLHQAPHGFYLSAYMRYAKYTLTSGYNDAYNGQQYGYDLTTTYSGTTIGLMLGHQWIISKHLSIDLWILGLGFGKAAFSLNATTQGVSIPADEQAHIKQSLQDELQRANYLNAADPVIETTDHSVKATMSGLPMVSYRGLGFCVGIAF